VSVEDGSVSLASATDESESFVSVVDKSELPKSVAYESESSVSVSDESSPLLMRSGELGSCSQCPCWAAVVPAVSQVDWSAAYKTLPQMLGRRSGFASHARQAH
jgi:hypothetical protein